MRREKRSISIAPVEEIAAEQGNVRDVSDPELVDSVRWWRIDQQVRTVAECVPAVGRTWLERPGLDGHQAHLCHQPADASPAARLVASRQLDGDPPRAITSAVFPEDAPNRGHQAVVFTPPRAEFVLPPGVIGGATRVEGFAQQGHRKTFLKLVDDHVDFVYILWLKMAKAFFKMSRSRSTRRSSFSN